MVLGLAWVKFKSGLPFLRGRLRESMSKTKIVATFGPASDSPPVRQQDYLSKAKQIFAPAHEELKKKNFLRKVNWKKKATDETYITYYPGTKAKAETR